MNAPANFTRVYVEDLGIDASEEDLGIVDIRRITIGRMTIIVLEADDGICALGYSAPWPWQRHDPLLSSAYARQKAIGSLKRVRQAAQERMWKGPKA